jgi:prepilin-type N-terminal cleavage/methylation domain-containing protein
MVCDMDTAPIVRRDETMNGHGTRMNQRTARSSGAASGFSLMELLVVIAIVAVLAALTFAVVPKMMAKAKDNKCISNLRQIGIGVRLYAAENNDSLVPGFARDTNNVPIAGPWQLTLAPYLNLPDKALRSDIAWQCPRAAGYQDTYGGRTSYAINGRLTYPDPGGNNRIRFISLPAGKRRFVLVIDQPMLNNDYVYENMIGSDAYTPVKEYFRHDGKIHVLWTDNTVSAIGYNELMADRFDLEKSLWKFQ